MAAEKRSSSPSPSTSAAAAAAAARTLLDIIRDDQPSTSFAAAATAGANAGAGGPLVCRAVSLLAPRTTSPPALTASHSLSINHHVVAARPCSAAKPCRVDIITPSASPRLAIDLSAAIPPLPIKGVLLTSMASSLSSSPSSIKPKEPNAILGRCTAEGARGRSGRSDKLRLPPPASWHALHHKEVFPSIDLKNPSSRSRTSTVFFTTGRHRHFHHRAFFGDSSADSSLPEQHLASLYLPLVLIWAIILPRLPPSRITPRRPGSPWSAHSGHPPPSPTSPVCSRYSAGPHAPPI